MATVRVYRGCIYWCPQDSVKDKIRELTKKQLERVTQVLQGCAIQVEHQPERIGTIIKAYQDPATYSLFVEFVLDSSSKTAAAIEKKVLAGEMIGLSLSHMLFADGGVIPTEVSICETPARAHAYIEVPASGKTSTHAYKLDQWTDRVPCLVRASNENTQPSLVLPIHSSMESTQNQQTPGTTNQTTVQDIVNPAAVEQNVLDMASPSFSATQQASQEQEQGGEDEVDVFQMVQSAIGDKTIPLELGNALIQTYAKQLESHNSLLESLMLEKQALESSGGGARSALDTGVLENIIEMIPQDEQGLLNSFQGYKEELQTNRSLTPESQAKFQRDFLRMSMTMRATNESLKKELAFTQERAQRLEASNQDLQQKVLYNQVMMHKQRSKKLQAQAQFREIRSTASSSALPSTIPQPMTISASRQAYDSVVPPPARKRPRSFVDQIIEEAQNSARPDSIMVHKAGQPETLTYPGSK